MTPSPDLAILRHLAARTHASAAEIGTASRMTLGWLIPGTVASEDRDFATGRQKRETSG